MELFEGFEIVDPYPALYVAALDAVVVADLHLGLESLMAEGGAYMPKFQLDELKADLDAIFDRVEPSRLIVCGDIKHEFSETSWGERDEVQAFIDFVSDRVAHITLIKGNHDNYLIYAVEDYDNVTLEDIVVEEGICFAHGHELVEDVETEDAEYLIIGHEHPALALTDSAGVTEKLPAFLYGDLDDGRQIIVLPAFSKLAEGSQVNQVSEQKLLSPILTDQVDIQTLEAVGIDREGGLFEFPSLGKLQEYGRP